MERRFNNIITTDDGGRKRVAKKGKRVVEIQNAKRIKRRMAGPPAANIVHSTNMLNGLL